MGVVVGPCPVRFLLCFSAGWRSSYLAGGSAFRPLRFCVCCCLFLCFDLPTYMTTGVHVDVILTCFFSCKDRASERYRPHQRKKTSIILMQEVACFQSMQSRHFEARRGLGEATPRTQNVLTQGQSEAHGGSKLYNAIVEVPARLDLK